MWKTLNMKVSSKCRESPETTTWQHHHILVTIRKTCLAFPPAKFYFIFYVLFWKKTEFVFARRPSGGNFGSAAVAAGRQPVTPVWEPFHQRPRRSGLFIKLQIKKKKSTKQILWTHTHTLSCSLMTPLIAMETVAYEERVSISGASTVNRLTHTHTLILTDVRLRKCFGWALSRLVE